MLEGTENLQQSRKKIKRLTIIIIVGAVLFMSILVFLLETL